MERIQGVKETLCKGEAEKNDGTLTVTDNRTGRRL